MKNISKYVLLVAALGLSACNMDEYVSYVSYPKQERMEFSAIADASESLNKSYIERIGNRWEVTFTNSDCIEVFTKDGSSSEFAVQELSKDAQTAIFSGTIAESDGYYAVFNATGAKVDGNVISVNVSESQRSDMYSDGNKGYDSKSAVRVAYTSAKDKVFRFQNATALIKMSTLQGDLIESVKFETLDGTPIAGDCKIEIGSDGRIASVSGGTSSSLCLDANGDRNLLASLLPCKIKKGNLKITIKSYENWGEGVEIVKYNSMDLDLKAGVLYSFAEVCDLQVKVFNGESDTNPLVLSTSAFKPSITLPVCDKPVAKGKELGYATSPNGKLVYKPGDVISPTSDMALYLVENTNKYCLKIETKDMVQNRWDAMFFIIAKDPFQGGDELVLSMDVKAKYPCTIISWLNSKDCLYTHYYAVQSPQISTQWNRVTVTGTVETGISTSQAIGFCLNEFADANIYYFDNISLTVNGKEQISNGDFENGQKSDQFKYYLYYGGGDLHDNQPRIPVPVVER